RLVELEESFPAGWEPSRLRDWRRPTNEAAPRDPRPNKATGGRRRGRISSTLERPPFPRTNEVDPGGSPPTDSIRSGRAAVPTRRPSGKDRGAPIVSLPAPPDCRRNPSSSFGLEVATRSARAVLRGRRGILPRAQGPSTPAAERRRGAEGRALGGDAAPRLTPPRPSLGAQATFFRALGTLRPGGPLSRESSPVADGGRSPCLWPGWPDLTTASRPSSLSDLSARATPTRGQTPDQGQALARPSRGAALQTLRSSLLRLLGPLDPSTASLQRSLRSAPTQTGPYRSDEKAVTRQIY
ncbi:hypothetical protein THAOC_09402, partial [Thalassiosira oceanica]